MRRVVVTGMGIVSCLGLDKESVTESLRTEKSGISYRPDYEEMGMRSHVAGAVDIDFSEYIDRKNLRFMGAAAAYGYISMARLSPMLAWKKTRSLISAPASSWARAEPQPRIR